MGSFVTITLALVVTAGTTLADPARSTADPPPLTRKPSLTPLLVLDLPPPPPPSLRLEALRVAGERAADDWRYPEPTPMLGYDQGAWFVGYGQYQPRTARSAALHAGSMASTLLGEILLSADSPVAGVGALLTGATLDAAGADVDRDAEARKH